MLDPLLSMKNFIQSSIENIEFLPMDMSPEKYFTISIEGFDKITLSFDNEVFINLSVLFSNQFKTLYEIYSEKYIFTEPQLIFKPENNPSQYIMQMKVGMMSKEKYNIIKSKAVKRDSKI